MPSAALAALTQALNSYAEKEMAEGENTQLSLDQKLEIDEARWTNEIKKTGMVDSGIPLLGGASSSLMSPAAKRKEDVTSSPAAAEEVIPTFYVRSTINPPPAEPEDDDEDDEEPSSSSNHKNNSSSSKYTSSYSDDLRNKLKNAARANEVTSRMNQMQLWDHSVMEKYWTMLSEVCPGATLVTFEKFTKVAREFEDWRRVYFEMEKSDVNYDELKQLSMLPCAFHVTRLPQLDALLYLSAPHSNDGCTAQQLYGAFIKQMALFKSETEFVMLDFDGDGCLTEDEMKSYVEDLIPTVNVLKDNLDENLYEYYCCSCVRRLFWLVDPSGSGKLKIEKLVQHGIMDAWLEVQLASKDPATNWFSYTIATSIHEKFAKLDRNKSGLLTVDDMRRYKKGLPTLEEDGLPEEVSPFTEFFLERVFEIMPLFDGEMDYRCFVDFVLAVELLPHCPRPSFFWEVFDIHSEGVLTPMTVNLFFRSVHSRLSGAGVGPPPLDLVVPELFHLIVTKEELKITREEFFKSDQNGLFASLMIDCLSFWSYENREQQMVQRAQERQESGEDFF